MTWEQLVTNKGRILRKTRARRKGRRNVSKSLAMPPCSKCRNLPENVKYDLALRIYDLMQYQDIALARDYVQTGSRISIAATAPTSLRRHGRGDLESGQGDAHQG